jgi:hypothetical protein
MIWKWLAGIAALLVAAAAIMFGIGLMLPRDHVARVARTFPAPPERMAALIRNVEGQPIWRRDVRSIDVQERAPGRVRYIEHSRQGDITYDLREEEPSRLFRSTIADPDLPFGGFWTIAVAPNGTGSRVEIVEHGSVRNPLFRFFSAFVFGHDATAKAWLLDLGNTIGAKTGP